MTNSAHSLRTIHNFSGFRELITSLVWKRAMNTSSISLTEYLLLSHYYFIVIYVMNVEVNV